MPPDQQHPQYAAVAPLWRKCRDAAAGQEAVHAAGPLYLPPLSGQSPAEYRAYRDRALFFNACGRTIDGLSGLVFRRPPYLRHPPGMALFVADVNGLGCALQGLAEQLVQEVLEVGRAGILVDYTPAGQGPQLAGEPGPRPVWTLYRAEDILDWRTQTRAGRQVLSQVRLADVLLLNKIDLTEPSDQEALYAQVRALNATAPIYRTSHGDTPPSVLYGVNFQQRPNRPAPHLPTMGNAASHQDDDITSALIPLGAPLDRTLFAHWTAAFPPTVLRVKGVVEFTDGDGPEIFQYVPGSARLSPASPDLPERFLVLIGQDAGSTAATLSKTLAI